MVHHKYIVLLFVAIGTSTMRGAEQYVQDVGAKSLVRAVGCTSHIIKPSKPIPSSPYRIKAFKAHEEAAAWAELVLILSPFLTDESSLKAS